MLEIHRVSPNLERIAVLAQPIQVLRQRKQAAWLHRNPPSNAAQKSQSARQSEGLLRVSSWPSKSRTAVLYKGSVIERALRDMQDTRSRPLRHPAQRELGGRLVSGRDIDG